MKEVKVTMYLEIEDNAIKEIKELEHHAEYLLDLDNWQEIKSVYGVKVEDLKFNNLDICLMDFLMEKYKEKDNAEYWLIYSNGIYKRGTAEDLLKRLSCYEAHSLYIKEIKIADYIYLIVEN